MKRVLLFVTVVAIALPASSQIHPNLQRGYAVDGAYHIGDIDSVNLFNGNLSVAIPLGSAIRVSDRLSYPLRLTYDSKLWDSRYVEGVPNSTTDPPRHKKDPTARSNAGLGWRLSLGRLIGPDETDINEQDVFRYEDPDGGDHVFYTELNGGLMATGGSFAYTHDATYMRLRLAQNGSDYWVEFPDGSSHKFERYEDGNITRYRLVELRDTAADVTGNSVSIVYGANAWTIAPDTPRQIRVVFGSAPPAPGSTAGRPAYYDSVVDYVEVPKFGGGVATYDLQYEGRQVLRGECGGRAPHPLDGVFVSVPLLTSIVIPAVGGVSVRYDVQYRPSPSLFSAAEACRSGVMEALTLPTFGQTRWTYDLYDLPTTRCSEEDLEQFTIGVNSRAMYQNAAAATPEMQWTYAQNLRWVDEQVPCGKTTVWSIPHDSSTTVTDKNGDQTVHYFSVRPKSPYNRGFGLPFAPSLKASGNRYISRKVCAGTCSDTTVLETTYVDYEWDLGTTYLNHRNRRLSASRTVYDADGGKWVDTDYDDYDGVGHYRVSTQTHSGFGGATSRQSIVDYNKPDPAIDADAAISTGTYDAATGTGFTLPPLTHPWRLNLFPRKKEVQTGQVSQSAVTQYCFDASTGFLERVRSLENASGPGIHDVVVDYSTDSTLNGGTLNATTGEKWYGGERVALPALSGTPCAAAAPAAVDYELKHTYENGVRAKTEYYSAGSSFAEALRQSIDPGTGIVSQSYDAAGVTSKYHYDAVRRMTKAELFSPSNVKAAADVVYEYTDPTAAAPAAKVKVTQSSSDSTQGSIGYDLEFDWRGRPRYERNLTPAGVWAQKETTYDGAGRVATVSEWDDPAKVTRFTYDALGRVTRTQGPDVPLDRAPGADYLGVRQVQRYAWIATDADGAETKSVTSEEHDAFGRLLSVTQRSGPTSVDLPVGADVKTEYRYDLGSRLSYVYMRQGQAGPFQERRFEYDALGRLRRENHPESGVTTYSAYDARGHAGTKLQGASTQNYIFDLKFNYDAAERLTHVYSRNPFYTPQFPQGGEFRLTKQFDFGFSNAGLNLLNGKLHRAIRYNYGATHETLEPAHGARYIVTETYEYGDLAGRRTRRITNIASQTGDGHPLIPVKEIEQSVIYNDLGLVKTMNYPTCSSCGVSTGPASIAYSYAGGRVKTIGDYLSNATYWPSGMAHTLTHSNGIVDTVDADPNVRSRPRSFTFGSWSECTPASIAVPPQGKTIASGQTTSITVVGGGTAPIQYQWFGAPSGSAPVLLAGQTASVLTTPQLTQSMTYFVRVSNACKSVDSPWVTVTVTCIDPLVAIVSGDRIIRSGETVVLSVAATGTAPLTYAWYRGSSGDTSTSVGVNAPEFSTPQLTATTRYWVRVTNPCGSIDSDTIVLTIPLAAPQNLTATRSSSTSIALSWGAVTGAAKYLVERRSGSAAFAVGVQVTGTTYSDAAGLEAGKTYVYRIRAVDALGGSTSAASNHDLATMMTFDSLSGADFIEARHFDDLRKAVNAVRAATGRAAVTWEQILPAGVAAPSGQPSLVLISSDHVTALRNAMTEALQAAGVAVGSYGTPPGGGDLIRHADLTAIRTKAQ